MKLASVVGLWVLVCSTALGCSSGRPSPPGFADYSGGDDSGGSTASSGSGSSGGSSGAPSSSGTGPSSSGGGAATSSSGGGSSSGASSDDGGGLQTSSQSDAATGDNPETDYTQTKTITMAPFPVPAELRGLLLPDLREPLGKAGRHQDLRPQHG